MTSQALIASIRKHSPGIFEGEEYRCPICHGTGFREPTLDDVLRELTERDISWYWGNRSKLVPKERAIYFHYNTHRHVTTSLEEVYAPDPTIAALSCLEAVLREEAGK